MARARRRLLQGFSRDGETRRPPGPPRALIAPGRAGRWGPLVALAAGFAVLVFLYWPVIVSGGAAFLVVRRLLRREVDAGRPRRFWRETAPRWIEAVALWRASSRLGR